MLAAYDVYLSVEKKINGETGMQFFHFISQLILKQFKSSTEN